MDEGTPQINNLGTMQGANFGDHNTYHQYFGPDGTPARAVPPDHLWTVPYLRNPLFTGREEVIRELHEQLTASRTAALAQAMSGLGGIGKTQTAVEYAYRYQTDYHHILWLRASTREEIIEDLTSLARLLQLPAQQAQDQQQIVNATRNWLQTHSGWLLIVDNADDLEMASDYLPTGSSGHILLTTRAHAMKGLAHKVELTTMPLDEGVLFLVHRAGLLAPPATLDHVSAAQREIAEAIVQALGHLPLALDQAGAYLEETGESLTSYLTLYREQRKAVLAYRGGLSTRHAPVATTWSLALTKLAAIHPASIDLMRLCAFLSADAIAEEMVTGGAQYVSRALHHVAKNRMSWNQVLEHLLTYSLLQRQPSTQTLSLHRLVQAVIADEMDAATRHDWVERAVRVVAEVFPSNEIAPWSLSQRYVLNALTCLGHAEQVQMESHNVWLLRYNVARYLSQRGQYTEAEVLYQQVLSSSEKLLGTEHPETLNTRHALALLYRDQGKYSEAEVLYQQVLTSFENLLGAEHPHTLSTRHNLAVLYKDRGKYTEAVFLFQQVLSSRENLLGAEHPHTLTTRQALANLIKDNHLKN